MVGQMLRTMPVRGTGRSQPKGQEENVRISGKMYGFQYFLTLFNSVISVADCVGKYKGVFVKLERKEGKRSSGSTKILPASREILALEVATVVRVRYTNDCIKAGGPPAGPTAETQLER